ncbi:MAG: hypothetical protein FJ077_11035, partial [Cyanobacteria bacterium K_DeepCast_35m_m2_023]|nr:hypothetical protein [Cyanobacteria bacterium K_DeepCast_35m_m2_023]
MTSLGLALLLALAIRLAGAVLRPVWVDEAASALFSAGNSSWSTPRNALVPLDAFVRALRIDAGSPLPQAMAHLQREDNHPPLHFALTAIGARLLQADGSVLHPLTARLPAVLLGSLAVPLLHQAVWTTTGSRRAARLAAAWMAVSPLAVAMGLEARHYALAITLVCAALWGLACCWQALRRGEPLKLGPQLIWLLINLCGVTTNHL